MIAILFKKISFNINYDQWTTKKYTIPFETGKFIRKKYMKCYIFYVDRSKCCDTNEFKQEWKNILR